MYLLSCSRLNGNAITVLQLQAKSFCYLNFIFTQPKALLLNTKLRRALAASLCKNAPDMPFTIASTAFLFQGMMTS